MRSTSLIFNKRNAWIIVALSLVFQGCRYSTSEGKKHELSNKQAKVTMNSLLAASEQYRADTGKFPNDPDYLVSEADGGKGETNYLTALVWLTDPWGIRYKYVNQTDRVTFVSAGADRQWNTGDDLVVTTEQEIPNQ